MYCICIAIFAMIKFQLLLVAALRINIASKNISCYWTKHCALYFVLYKNIMYNTKLLPFFVQTQYLCVCRPIVFHLYFSDFDYFGSIPERFEDAFEWYHQNSKRTSIKNEINRKSSFSKISHIWWKSKCDWQLWILNDCGIIDRLTDDTKIRQVFTWNLM